MILKILVGNFIVTVGLLMSGNIGWGLLLYSGTLLLACLDDWFTCECEIEHDDSQPPNTPATV